MEAFRLRDFKLNDYVICAIGIIGAFHAIGLFGRFMGVLRILFLFTSTGVVAYSASALSVSWLAGRLMPTERRVYLLYIVTNSLPPLFALTEHLFR